MLSIRNIFTFFSVFLLATTLLFAQSKPRIIVETDLGGDADDQATLVRFLLYANEFDIEGIILSRPKNKFGKQEDPLFDDPTGGATDPLVMAKRYLKKYGEVVNNLNIHAPAGRKYPSQAYLESVTKWAHNSNNTTSDAGVNRIISALKESYSPYDNRRIIWFTNWGSNDGTESSLKRALDLIKAGSVSGLDYNNVVSRIRFVEYENLNNGRSLLGSHLSAIRYKMDTFLPHISGYRWSDRWRSLTGDRAWIKSVGNGLSRYYTTEKEGDTMTWMHLIDNGINVIGFPEDGGWAGRYTTSSSGFQKCDVSETSPNNSRTNRDNSLVRWGTDGNKANDIINDFRARWQWTKHSDKTKANHAPVPKVLVSREEIIEDEPVYEVFMTSNGTQPLFEFSSNGVNILLDASASSDPDGHSLTYQWVLYKELTSPGLRGAVITQPNSAKTIVKIPNNSVEGYVVLYLRVTDRPGSGKIPMTRYQRVSFKTVGLPYDSTSMKLADRSNKVLPANLVIRRQSNTSFQVRVQATPSTTPISKIELYSNNKRISTDATAPYIFNLNQSLPGRYQVKARLWYNSNSYSVYSNVSTITVKDVFIGSIAHHSRKPYKIMENFGKVKYFTDRSYKVTSYPSFLNKAEYVMTPDADKSRTTTNLLQIKLNKTADVYVAYDRRLPRIPVWLRSYTDTREHVRTSDGQIFRVYKKKFNPGTAILGGAESRQTNSSNYFVMVKKPLVLPPTKLITSIAHHSRKSYRAMANFGKVLYFTDKSFKVTILPSYLTNAEYVMTPDSDKALTKNPLLIVNLKEAADVYVAYDRRLPRIPVWLRAYTDTREHIRTSHGVIFRLYKKRFAAGAAVLGGAESRQDNSSNYFVIAKAVYAPATRATTNLTEEVTPIVKVNPHPVPTTGKVFINNPAGNAWNLTNTKGKVLLKGNKSVIDLSTCAEGIYLLIINGKTYRVVKKNK